MAYRNIRVTDATVRKVWLDRSLTRYTMPAAAGCSYDTLRKRAAELGLPKRIAGRPVVADLTNLVFLWNEGVPSRGIADTLGCDPSTVTKCAAKLGLARRDHRWRGKTTLADLIAKLTRNAMARDAELLHARLEKKQMVDKFNKAA